MLHNTIKINENSKLVLYIPDEKHKERGKTPVPMVIVVPGGGYSFCCEREAEPVALSFVERGFASAVLYYSVVPQVYPSALTELAKAVSIIRDHSTEWNIKKDGIGITGFSAGGHLAANLAVKWQTEELEKLTGLTAESVKPNALVLAYPVISTGKYIHKDSFVNLLGDEAGNKKLLENLSLENYVTDKCPTTFIWTTLEDEVVDYHNTLIFADALDKAGISYELHVFPVCNHGSSICVPDTLMEGPDEKYEYLQCWVDLAGVFLHRALGA